MKLRFVLGTCLSFFACTNGIDKGRDQAGAGTTVQVSGDDAIVIGDWGTGDQLQAQTGRAMANFCKVKLCNMALTVGDNFYPKGVSSPDDPQWVSKFEVPYKDVPLVFYPTLGNHDHDGSWTAQVDRTHRSKKWKMPGRYYQVSAPTADYFAIDSEYFWDDKMQKTWLEAALKASTKRWKIVYGHHPIFSSGPHGDSFFLQKALLPLLEKYGVQFYISGHDHHLEHLEKKGVAVAFLISGSGGKKRDVWWKKDFSKFLKVENGFLYLDLEDAAASFSFVDKSGNIIYSAQYPK